MPKHDDDQARSLEARRRLGVILKSRREELRLRGTEVAARAGISPQFYGEIEKGVRSTPHVRVWMLLSNELQLDRNWLLEQVWAAREEISIRIPDAEDPKRRALIAVVVELYSDSAVLP